MVNIRGRHSFPISTAAIVEWAARYSDVTIDIGTGDGRFVHHMARCAPTRAVIGLDTCRENMTEASRKAPDNALYVVADALALPDGFQRISDHVTINFPWGSLLRGLLDADVRLLDGLKAIARTNMLLEVRLNSGALAQAGSPFEGGGQQAAQGLRAAGFEVGPLQVVDRNNLRRYPTTWAKRLAYGKDPRALHLKAVLQADRAPMRARRINSTRGAAWIDLDPACPR